MYSLCGLDLGGLWWAVYVCRQSREGIELTEILPSFPSCSSYFKIISSFPAALPTYQAFLPALPAIPQMPFLVLLIFRCFFNQVVSGPESRGSYSPNSKQTALFQTVIYKEKEKESCPVPRTLLRINQSLKNVPSPSQVPWQTYKSTRSSGWGTWLVQPKKVINTRTC